MASKGDLTDIVRNTIITGPPATAIFSNNLQLLPEPATAFEDPLLLDKFSVPTFFKEKIERSRSSCLFSTILHISPVTAKVLPVIRPPSVDHGSDLQISSPRIQGIKRRKSQAKKVVCIPAPATASGEAVPSDLWAWRKYGQKPIKGSPYPRAYYRCSSSKGCSARKQVERSRTDPNMLVMTYTSEHNHPWPTQRNALAGSTRFQPSKSNKASTSKLSDPPKECSCSSNQVVKEEELEREGKPLIDPQDHDFHNVFDGSFNEHMMLMESDHPNDFFFDLAELGDSWEIS